MFFYGGLVYVDIDAEEAYHKNGRREKTNEALSPPFK
jgi:hypothetical protein